LAPRFFGASILVPPWKPGAPTDLELATGLVCVCACMWFQQLSYTTHMAQSSWYHLPSRASVQHERCYLAEAVELRRP